MYTTNVIPTGVPPLRHTSGAGTLHVHIGSTTARTPTNEVVFVKTADGDAASMLRKLVQDPSHDALSIRHSSMLIISNLTPSSCSIWRQKLHTLYQSIVDTKLCTQQNPNFVKTPYTGFHENMTSNLVAETRIWTAGWTWSPYWVFLWTIPKKRSACMY
jgi:hypothetical protein